MKKLPSIFNDVLSPITPGPSSSNTAGVHRILFTLSELLGCAAESLVMEMRDDGGFADTFFGMQSDLAATAGAMGIALDARALSGIGQKADARSLTRRFFFSPDIPRDPSECARITLSGGGRSISAFASSLGGGAFLLSEIEGFCVDISGYDSCVLIALDHASDPGAVAARASLLLGGDARVCRRPASALTAGTFAALIEVHTQNAPGPEAAAQLRAIPHAKRVMLASRRYPFNSINGAAAPFTNAHELLSYSLETGRTLYECAVEYEGALTGLCEKEITDHARRLWDITACAVETGLNGVCFEGVTEPRAATLPEIMPVPLGAGDLAIRAALAVMETSCAHGTIVCMPTGGSSGVVPGAIMGVSRALNLKRENELRALIVSGLIGAFFFETNYSGSLGCQAEVGVAAAMAAAAVSEMKCQNARTALEAASFAVQSLLGLVCDPIAGYVQLPCFIRNMTGVTTALTASNAALSGMKSGVPLDEMAAVLLDVGKALRPVNACGTCNAPHARQLERALTGR